jgi:putative ABC transport system substrate-binding protein
MTTRRQFLLAGALGALGVPHGRAQPRPARVGMLTPRAKSFFAPTVIRRLAELGYREGSRMVLEYRHADGVVERFPLLARELISLKCDLIFAIGPEHAARALRDAPSPVPVVFLAVDYDPLEKGIIASLARPGGNLTGVYALNPEITLKRLEIAQEVLPKASRFLVLSDVYTRDQLVALQKVADARRVQLTVAELVKPHRYVAAFETARQARAEALIVLTSPVFADDRAEISALALNQRLPAIGFVSPEADFLVGYSSNVTKMSYRVAEIGVQILKGAKPAEIPVEQAGEFDLVINLKMAKALGVKIPYSVMARATKVIE